LDEQGDWDDYLFSFEGRISRGEYWLFVAICAGYAFIAGFLVMAVFSYSDRWHVRFVSFVLSLPLLWPGLAIAVKRLHDRDKGREWAWFLIGVPTIGHYITLIANFAIARPGLLSYPLLALQVATIAVGLRAFVELGFFRGTAGDNRFGPDPLPPVAVLPGGRKVVQSPAPGGHRVRVTRPQPDGSMKKVYYYVAESDPEEARIIVRDAMSARDEDVATVDTILHQTVQNLGMRPGEFVPVPLPK
jgi:uncharacterized membrane protein YhaH (DUF805 family)